MTRLKVISLEFLKKAEKPLNCPSRGFVHFLQMTWTKIVVFGVKFRSKFVNRLFFVYFVREVGQSE